MATKKGVTTSEALEDFATVARIDAPALSTFEVWHPSLDEPIYLVKNNADFVATKEATAARDAGEEVTFMKADILVQHPEESDEAAAPEWGLTVANVSGLMLDKLRANRGSLSPWALIIRVYMANRPEAPAQTPPIELLIVGVDMNEQQLTIRGRFADPVNVSVPAQTFRRHEYPVLLP